MGDPKDHGGTLRPAGRNQERDTGLRQENLIKRWKNDRDCDWRTDEWLNVSLKSLDGFASMDHAIDTSHLSADRIADLIMQYETVSVSGFH